jgi:hypothetical protein
MMAGMVFAFLTAALKSKCTKAKCGCIEIDRNVDAEIEAMRIENRRSARNTRTNTLLGLPSDNSISNINPSDIIRS